MNTSGYTAVLQNRHFRSLWLAQVVSNTALNASFFVQLILIEEVTGSSAHLGAVILAFSLPAVLLSAIAGMIVDRVSKKTILIWSNALRVLTGAALAILAALLPGNKWIEALFLTAIYILVFVTSAIGQFFAPAEGATIPLLVRADNLLPANSLFTLTFIASQILGMIILAPLGVKLIGIAGSLWVAVALYVAATLFVAVIPRDQPARAETFDGVSAARRAWNEIREGWHFAIAHRAIFVALLQLALTNTLTLVMAELVPGFAKRVLGLQPEDAIYIFWPAGAGVLLASILIGRFAQRIPREILAVGGMIGVALGLMGLAWVGSGSLVFGQPLFVRFPELFLTTSALVMLFSLVIGMTMAAINIPAQTIVQERSNDAVRGRVLAVQFTIANLIALPPMLFVGNLADVYGIPRVTVLVAAGVAFCALINLAWTLTRYRAARARHRSATHSHSTHQSS
ncbi:MAG: MFS transporter [Chloroflexi bacterium]|nr:MFS transporter [Chloroflexota bacterium]